MMLIISIFFQPILIDTLVKMGISCKKKPESYIIKESSGVLQLITHEEFSSLILPSLQKAMLRSPEIILESIGFVLYGLSLDLSQYAMDIGKVLVGKKLVLFIMKIVFSAFCQRDMTYFSEFAFKGRLVTN